MTKKKEARCIYNAARAVCESFLPQCTWLPPGIPKDAPPGFHYVRDQMTERTCRKCKAFVDIDNQK